jgi:hypothetical protein
LWNRIRRRPWYYVNRGLLRIYRTETEIDSTSNNAPDQGATASNRLKYACADGVEAAATPNVDATAATQLIMANERTYVESHRRAKLEDEQALQKLEIKYTPKAGNSPQTRI